MDAEKGARTRHHRLSRGDPRGDEPLPGENQTGERKLGSDENNTSEP